MYAQLGQYKFEALKGYDSFTNTFAMKYADYEFINRKPASNSTGPELEKITMSIQFHSSFCVPEIEVDSFRKSCYDSEILPLVFGNGKFAGNFVIVSATQTVRHTDPVGNVILCGLSIELKEFYSADKLRQREEAMVLNATALAQNIPLETRVVPPAMATAQQRITEANRNIQISASGAGFSVTKMVQDAALYTVMAARAINDLQSLARSAQYIASVINNLPASGPDLDSAIQSMLNVTQDSIDQIRSTTNTETFKGIPKALNDASKAVSTAAAFIRLKNLLRIP